MFGEISSSISTQEVWTCEPIWVDINSVKLTQVWTRHDKLKYLCICIVENWFIFYTFKYKFYHLPFIKMNWFASFESKWCKMISWFFTEMTILLKCWNSNQFWNHIFLCICCEFAWVNVRFQKRTNVVSD